MSQGHARRRLDRAARGVAIGSVDALDAAGVRTLVGAVLFDGAGVPEWHTRAACGGEDPGLFFAGSGPQAFRDRRRALAICAGCPVRVECVADALAWEQPSTRTGIRGGLSASQRQRVYEHHRDRHGGCGAATGEGVVA